MFGVLGPPPDLHSAMDKERSQKCEYHRNENDPGQRIREAFRPPLPRPSFELPRQFAIVLPGVLVGGVLESEMNFIALVARSYDEANIIELEGVVDSGHYRSHAVEAKKSSIALSQRSLDVQRDISRFELSDLLEFPFVV